MSTPLAIAFTILAACLFIRRLIRWYFEARKNAGDDNARKLSNREAVHVAFETIPTARCTTFETGVDFPPPDRGFEVERPYPIARRGRR